MRNYLISLSQFLAGACLLGIGCALLIHANLGADPLSCMALGLQLHIQGNVEQGILWISIFMMMITYFIDRHQLGLGSLLYPFVSAYAIRVTLLALPIINDLVLRYVILLLGILCMGVSIAICANQRCGNNPYDSLVFALMKKWNRSYTFIRYRMDATLIISGILLGNMFGIGTILILILLGPCAQGCIMIKMKMMLLKQKKGVHVYE